MTNENLFLSITFFLISIMLFCNGCAQEQNASVDETISCEEIILMCAQTKGGEYIIKNNAEYQELLRVRSSHPNCSGYDLPTIDFNQYTLIGYLSPASGCITPTINHEVIKTSQGNYVIDIIITEYGGCKPNWDVGFWCLIPKLENNTFVEFNVNTNN